MRNEERSTGSVIGGRGSGYVRYVVFYYGRMCDMIGAGFVRWLTEGCFANNDRFPWVSPFMERLLSAGKSSILVCMIEKVVERIY